MDPKDMPDASPEWVTDQDRLDDAEDVRSILNRALRSLPLHLRTPLLMFHMDESTYAEIGERLLISPDNAQKRVSLARSRLRTFLRRAGLERDCRELLRTYCLAAPAVPIWLDDLMSLVKDIATPAKETSRAASTRPAAYAGIAAVATLGVLVGVATTSWSAWSGGARGLPERDGALASWADETYSVAIMPPVAASRVIPVVGDIDDPAFPGVAASRGTRASATAGRWPTADDHTLVVSRSVGSLTHLWAVTDGGSRSTRLTSGRHRDRNPSVSPDGATVAFSRTADGQSLQQADRRELWTLSLSDGIERRLTADPLYSDDEPTWSRDGRELAFVRLNRDRDTNAPYSGRIWRIPAPGGQAARVSGVDGLSRQAPFYTNSGHHLIMSMETAPGVFALWTTDLRTGEERPVQGVPDDVLNPQASPDGSTVAYASGRHGNLDVYTVGFDGKGLRRLTRDPQEDTDPTWTPDGSRVVWSTTRDGTRTLYSMKTDGSDKARVSLGGDGYVRGAWSTAGLPMDVTSSATGPMLNVGRPSVSPTNPHLLLVQAQQARDMEIATYDPTTGLRLLTRNEVPDKHPVWSPDGRRVAFASHRHGSWDLFTMAADGSDVRRVTTGDANEEWPAWSPDGSRIAYASRPRGSSSIWTISPDGDDARRLTPGLASAIAPAWSPDGGRIAFQTNRDGDDEVYVMNADGSDARNITSHAAHDRAPAWSPDGRFICFSSLRDGDTELYTLEVATRAVTRLTFSPGTDGEPRWVGDGSAVMFVSNRRGLDRVHKLPVPGPAQLSVAMR